MFFVFVDLGDICNIGRNSGSIIPHPGISESHTLDTQDRSADLPNTRYDSQ